MPVVCVSNNEVAMSASKDGWSSYRARKKGIVVKGKAGRDGGGKTMKKRRVWFEKDGVAVENVKK